MLQFAGCTLLGGKTGSMVAIKLKTGMTKDEVFYVLRQGATSVEERSYRSLINQSWDNIIESKAVLTALRDAEEETGTKIHKYIEVSRTWGMAGFDIFHLFLSEDETLIGYNQQHIN
jgi:thiamine kinase-like enzyme